MSRINKRFTSENRRFIATLLIFSFALFWYFFDGTTSNINTTMLAFRYQYGFISRGLLGTIYGFLDDMLPWNLQTFGCAMIFFEGCFLIFVALLFAFCIRCLRNTAKASQNVMQYLIILYFIVAIPMFCSEYNLGRLDMYCLMCSIASVYLLVVGCVEWLAIPLSAIGVLFHQGHVFMYMGMVLALQLYRAIDIAGTQNNGISTVFHDKSSRKYLTQFAITFIVVSVLFIYFEGFSHVNGESFVDEIVETACSMGPKGDYHIEVVDHEILGVDLSAQEWEYHKQNFTELPIYLVLILPYIVIFARFFKGVLSAAKTNVEKLKYWILVLGSLTILPEFILKVDYGRWIFAVISYYMIVLIALYGMGDAIIEEQGLVTFARIKARYPFAGILLVYPLLFQPLMHISICPLTERIVNIINVHAGIWVPWQ